MRLLCLEPPWREYPNVTHGFDCTFGPQYYPFNGGRSATLQELKAEAETLADSQRDTDSMIILPNTLSDMYHLADGEVCRDT